MMKNTFKNKNILITGHTGFKGSWLTAWLYTLGANITAISKDVPTKPAHYNLMRGFIKNDITEDLANYDRIFQIINEAKPDYIFHLAAQPIVLTSYNDPYLTFQSNAVGTLNILETLRVLNPNCTAVIITSDKCYENIEQSIGYKETDRLGGKDPYSSSKACAEIIIKGYYESFFSQPASNVKIASSRAGNVIGGGDWAEHRIVPDCIKAWSEKKPVILRNSLSTRPWQHVLEPLGGYLTLANQLNESSNLNGESFNFGPDDKNTYSVGNLVSEISKKWKGAQWVDETHNDNKKYEAGLLSLNCSKALKLLKWKSIMSFEKTAGLTGEWYYEYYNNSPEDAIKLTLSQIEEYNSIL
tara:strand:+ start:1388 stop:2455 length:1068 start_codon:yes stop_codon:yes gene_type:complete